MTPRGKEQIIEYAVRDLRGLEQNGQLRTMKGTPFKTITAAAGNHKADGGPAISDRGLACVYKIVLALVLTW